VVARLGEEKVKACGSAAPILATSTRPACAAWLREDAGGVLLHVPSGKPGARAMPYAGEHGGRLKIAIGAPPLEGRANDALVEFLAARLDLPRRQVRLVAGQRSRDKTLRAEAVSAGEALRRLARTRTAGARRRRTDCADGIGSARATGSAASAPVS